MPILRADLAGQPAGWFPTQRGACLDMLEEHLVDEIQHSRWLKAQIAVLRQ